jgi:hypothetical protein
MAAMPATITRSEVAVELREAVQAFTAAQRRLRGRDAKAGGLSFAQFYLMRRLAEVDESPASKLAARRRRLAGLGHPGPRPPSPRSASLSAVRGDTDRRVVLNRLTPRRSRGLRGKRAELEQRWQEALADLSADRLGQARSGAASDGRGAGRHPARRPSASACDAARRELHHRGKGVRGGGRRLAAPRRRRHPNCVELVSLSDGNPTQFAGGRPRAAAPPRTPFPR